MHRKFFALIATLVAFPALAQVIVTDPWVRGTVSQQKATGAFMNLRAVQDARLVAVQSPVAGVVEIHEMAMEKDVMKMRALPKGLELPAGKTVELKPGGFHIMLMDLKQPIKSGEVPLTLVFEGKDGKQTSVEVKAAVKPLGAPDKMEKMDAMHGHGHKH